MIAACENSCLLRRIPKPPLGRYINCLWYGATYSAAHAMERVLPTGSVPVTLGGKPLGRINDLTLPCLLLLENRGACVLVDLLPGERAQVALPEVGDGAIELPLADLAERYAGYVLFARPRLRFDRRADQLERTEAPSWFWGTLAQAWPIYAEVVLAAALIN